MQYLFGACLDIFCCQNLRKSSETMEEHGDELDYHDGSEEQDKDHSDGFQLKVFHLHVNLLEARAPNSNYKTPLVRCDPVVTVGQLGGS